MEIDEFLKNLTTIELLQLLKQSDDAGDKDTVIKIQNILKRKK
jgi:hypothetical protein